METYILHIYRRQPVSPGKGRLRQVDRVSLLGVLEEAGSRRKVIFHDMNELWEQLVWNGREER